MTIHPFIQSGGAMIGGLVTLALIAYNVISLISPNRNCSGTGCSIK